MNDFLEGPLTSDKIANEAYRLGVAHGEIFKRAFELGIQTERERCAKVAEEYDRTDLEPYGETSHGILIARKIRSAE